MNKLLVTLFITTLIAISFVSCELFEEGYNGQCKGHASSTDQRCRNNTTNDNGYCYEHLAQVPENEK